MPLSLTPAMQTAVRLLAKGDLHAMEFNTWALESDARSGKKPPASRFVSATVIRKMLNRELIATVDANTVRLTEKGHRARNNLPEIRRSLKRENTPRQLKSKPAGRQKGVTIYQFDYAGKTQSFTTERSLTNAIRQIQAKAWSKNPDNVPTIEVRATRLNHITNDNAAVVLEKGLEAIIAETMVDSFEPVERKGYYRHWFDHKAGSM